MGRGNPFGEMIGEVIGAISLAFMGIIFILVLATLEEATGQNEIISQAISAIVILIGGFGIPIGIIWLIKFLEEHLNGNY
jgi:hypothetical protein